MKKAIFGKKKVGVLISGRGSNLGELIAACQAPDYPAQIVLVISNNDSAGGLQRAAEAGIATQFIPHHGKSREAFDNELDKALRAAGVELICLAGFMRILSDGFTRTWEGKLINIHPSLLPAYKGTRVHERVIAAREAQSGASVHFVVPELDAGPVIAQASVPVHANDTPEALATRILEVEHRLYPAALRLLAEEKVKLQNGLAVFSDRISENPTFRVVLACTGIPTAKGTQAATDIQQEFKEFRGPRYTNAKCVFQKGELVLSCDNDGWDSDGRNLIDEFSDCISAYVTRSFDGDIKLISVTAL